MPDKYEVTGPHDEEWYCEDWHYVTGPDGYKSAICYFESDAHRIAQALNCHEQLVEAIKAVEWGGLNEYHNCELRLESCPVCFGVRPFEPSGVSDEYRELHGKVHLGHHAFCDLAAALAAAKETP